MFTFPFRLAVKSGGTVPYIQPNRQVSFPPFEHKDIRFGHIVLVLYLVNVSSSIKKKSDNVIMPMLAGKIKSCNTSLYGKI